MIQRILEPHIVEPDQAFLKALLDAFVLSTIPQPQVINLAHQRPWPLEKPNGEIIVYVGGSWDCFGAGHLLYLGRAKEALSPRESSSSCLLAVGVWSDHVRAFLKAVLF